MYNKTHAALIFSVIFLLRSSKNLKKNINFEMPKSNLLLCYMNKAKIEEIY